MHASGTGGNMFVAQREAQIVGVYGSQHRIYRSNFLTSNNALCTVGPRMGAEELDIGYTALK